MQRGRGSESDRHMVTRALKRHPAVDQVGMAGDVARFVRGEEDGECRDLLRFAEPAHGLALDEGLLDLLERLAGRLRAVLDATFERG